MKETVNSEVQETETPLTQENVIPAQSNNPLINGFRDKTVVLPLAHLQREFNQLKKLVGGGFKEVQDHANDQYRSIYRAIAEIANNTRSLGIQLEAVVRLGGISEKDLQTTIDTIEQEQADKKELEADKKAGRTIVNRPAALGDTVRINYIGKIDGTEFPGGSSKNVNLTLGSNQFIPGFETQLVGAKAGDVVEVKVAFPKEYANKEVEGKDAVFTTTVVSVKENVKTVDSTESVA